MYPDWRPGPLPLALALLGFLAPVLLALDIATSLSFTAHATVLVLLFSHRRRWYWLFILLGLTVASLGVFVSNALYTRDLGQETVALLGWSLPRANLERALKLAVRAWALGSISAASWMLIDPQDFVDALMQQARLPIRWGYALWTALNALPRLHETERSVRTVQRYRSGQRRRAFFPTAVSLLAAMVRFSEHAALFLAERGLEQARLPRHWYRPLPWRGVDTLVLVASWALAALTVAVLVHLNLFQFGLYL